MENQLMQSVKNKVDEFWNGLWQYFPSAKNPRRISIYDGNSDDHKLFLTDRKVIRDHSW